MLKLASIARKGKERCVSEKEGKQESEQQRVMMMMMRVWCNSISNWSTQLTTNGVGGDKPTWENRDLRAPRSVCNEWINPADKYKLPILILIHSRRQCLLVEVVGMTALAATTLLISVAAGVLGNLNLNCNWIKIVKWRILKGGSRRRRNGMK